jgi:hypothetical protein
MVDTAVSHLRTCGFRLVVFDFDLCMLRIHSFGQRLTPAQVLERNIENDFTDLNLLREFVLSLRNAGLHVAVASFGKAEVIRTYLERAFEEFRCADGSLPFTAENINTPQSVGRVDGFNDKLNGKNIQLDSLATQFGVMKENILFFDGVLADVGVCWLTHSFFTHARALLLIESTLQTMKKTSNLLSWVGGTQYMLQTV